MVSSQEKWGGGEELLASIATALRASGHATGWITRTHSGVSERLAGAGSTLLHQFSGRGHSPREILRVRGVIKRWSPDVLIMNDTHAVLLAGLATLGLGNRQPLRFAYKHTVFPLRSALKYRVLTDRVICVSQAAERVVMEGGLPSEKTAVIYGGTKPMKPLPFCALNEQQRVERRIALGLQAAAKRMLLVAVGSLLTCKGHDHLLDAMSRIPVAERPFLAIAGDGDQRQKLCDMIARLGLQHDVELLGYRADVEDLMNAADLLVHPSLAEGLSLVLIQAQMMHKPIVATAVGGAAEVLGEHQTIAKWLVEPADPEHLSSQIRSAISALQSTSKSAMCQQLEQTGQRAAERFSIDRNSQHLVELAASLL